MYLSITFSVKLLLIVLGLAGCQTPASDDATSNAQATPSIAVIPTTDTLKTNTVEAVTPPSENQLELPAQTVTNDYNKSYDFSSPDVSFKLKSDLKEISGLTVLDDQHLAAIQDEKGKIYSIRISDGKIVEDKRFAKNGDFEGIELLGDTFYVLRSDGDIYEVSGWPTDDTDSEKFETFLSTKNDTEGLAYDAANNRLLVVCKENPGAGLKNSRTVYAFDLATRSLQEDPVLVIDLKQLEKATPDNALNKFIRNLVAPLQDLSGFKPAAIAVHPITNQIFVISSVRKILLAYNFNGTLENLWILPEDDFRQPEGLAFMPNGDLFISNEGGNGKATLMRFNYK